MNDIPPRSAARFVVPVSVLGCIAFAFALYAWGGVGPAEQQLIALAGMSPIASWISVAPRQGDMLAALHRDAPVADAASSAQ